MKTGSAPLRWMQWIINIIILAALAASVVMIFGLRSELQSLRLTDMDGVDFYEEQENLLDPALCEDFFYDYDGSIVAAQNGSLMSNWIPCSAGQQLTRNGTATNVVCYFDADKNFLQRVDSFGLATITVPDDERIAYVRMAVQPTEGRMIVYGDKLSDPEIKRDYLTIDELIVYDRNLADDPTILEAPNGTQWRIHVEDDGSLRAVDVSGTIRASGLPEDFPNYTLTGRSVSDEDFLVTMSGETSVGYNYIFVMTAEGYIRWYDQVPGYAYNFRRIEYADGMVRYAYQQCYAKVENTNGDISYSRIVLLDEDFNVINGDIRPLVSGSITDPEHGCENHDYKILADDHYILTSVTLEYAENVPGLEGRRVPVVNNIIQEQKAGEVLLHWESINHPELYEASIYNNDYEALAADPEALHTDYLHINSIAVDAENYDLLVSFRTTGLVKLDRDSGDILWIMGRGASNIEGARIEQIGLFQHDVRYLDDGSITVFDNAGGPDGTSRVCRYWIDEEALTLSDFEEFRTEYSSSSMGGAELMDEETDTYLICYGGSAVDFAFEERDFSTGEVNMQLVIENGTNLYRIFRGTEQTPTEI